MELVNGFDRHGVEVTLSDVDSDLEEESDVDSDLEEESVVRCRFGSPARQHTNCISPLNSLHHQNPQPSDSQSLFKKAGTKSFVRRNIRVKFRPTRRRRTTTRRRRTDAQKADAEHPLPGGRGPGGWFPPEEANEHPKKRCDSPASPLVVDLT